MWLRESPHWQARSGDRGLHDQLLLPHQTFRGNQRLPAGRDLGLRARHLDRRQGALVHLVLVVLVQPLGEPQ